jgi:hypothetical protein
MFDYINSLEREGLIKLGKKYKVLGYLSDFYNPYLSDNELRKSIIAKIEEENPEETLVEHSKKKSQKKQKSLKRQHNNFKKNNLKSRSKKHRDLGYDINLKIKHTPSYYPCRNNKIVAIGDLHGDLTVTIKSLKLAGVIPLDTPNYFKDLKDIDDIEWIGGSTIVVQVGDQIDRCRPNNWYRDICADDSTYEDEGSDLKIMELLDKLNDKAKFQDGKIISILGNHEIMNCVGDFRYVSPKEFEEFGHFYKVKKVNNPNRVFPYGYKERKQAFSPGGIIARKYAFNRKAIVQVGKWIFVHGGLTPSIALQYSFDEMNEGISDWLLGRRDRKTKEIFEALYDDDDNGIFWTREFGDLGNWDDERSTKLFNRTLDNVNKKNDRQEEELADGLVMGHTPQYMNNLGINSSCNQRLWRVDIGASKAFGPFAKSEYENQFRKTAVLVIENDKCRILREK